MNPQKNSYEVSLTIFKEKSGSTLVWRSPKLYLFHLCMWGNYFDCPLPLDVFPPGFQQKTPPPTTENALQMSFFVLIWVWPQINQTDNLMTLRSGYSGVGEPPPQTIYSLSMRLLSVFPAHEPAHTWIPCLPFSTSPVAQLHAPSIALLFLPLPPSS